MEKLFITKSSNHNPVFVKFTRVSGNTKTGPIPVTITSSNSCPDACALKGAGCYAETGPLAMHWKRVDQGQQASSWDDAMQGEPAGGGFLQQIAALPKGQLWRHNTAGDLPHNQGAIRQDLLHALLEANKGKRGFTYTHHEITAGGHNAVHNREWIKASNAAGFTINLSANSMQHADELKALEVGPVVCLMPADAPKVSTTPAGNTVVLCPATYQDSINCSNCGICQVQTRVAIIGFPVHGTRKKKAAQVITLYRSPSQASTAGQALD